MKTTILLIAIILLAGCATSRVVPEPEDPFQAAAVFIKDNKFKDAIAEYKRIAAEAPAESALAADALYEIALVHAHHDNPQRDLVQAMQAFEQFIRRYPDNNKKDKAKTWISVLKTMQELKKENETLRLSIEQLKSLDIRHEEKRKRK